MSTVKFTAPPSDDDNIVVNNVITSADSPVKEPYAPVPQDDDADNGEMTDKEANEALEKFLGAKDRYKDPDTDKMYIPSLDANVVVRELHASEADTVYRMFSEVANLTNRAQRRAAGPEHKGMVKTAAYVVSIALVSPDVRNPHIFAKFKNKFGEDLTMPDLILRLFKPGEILSLNERILELTGGADEAIEEAKN